MSWHDLDFNPTTDRQAEDRVHRIGQTKEVKIYKLVAKGTVDAGIYAVAERKRKLEAQLLGEDGDEKGGAPATEIGQIILGVVVLLKLSAIRGQVG